MEACFECGGEKRTMKHRHVTNIGGMKVWDEMTRKSTCTECGEVDITLEDLVGYERRAAALVLRSVAKATGPMVLAARKALGLNQEELGKLFECAPETISRWENGHLAVQRGEQLALVAVLDLAEDKHIDPRDLTETLGQPSPTSLVVPPGPEKAA